MKRVFLCFSVVVNLIFLTFFILDNNKETTIYKTEYIEVYSESNVGGYEVLGGNEINHFHVDNGDLVFPIRDEDFIAYTSPFGQRISPFLNVLVNHNGVDIFTIYRAQVVSVADGIVKEHYPPPGALRYDGIRFRGHPIYGGMISIQHDGFVTLYAHLDETNVFTNQQVRAGQIIGRVGNTGMSTGRHLHFEMKIKDSYVNPLLYISYLNN